MLDSKANKALDFIERHPGILKRVSTMTTMDEVKSYLNDLTKNNEISRSENRFVSDLWNLANKHPEIWPSVKQGLRGILHAPVFAGVHGIRTLPGVVLTSLGIMAKDFLLHRHLQKLDIQKNKDILTMEEVSLFIEDFRNLYNNTIDVIYEQADEEMPIEKVITYNEAAYILNEILDYR